MNATGQVLVVEDEKEIREFVALTLSDEGYEVLQASDGAAALKVLDQHQPGVILLDMRMPIMDGWAFSQAYRQLPAKHVPIIVLTAATDAATFAAQINAEGFLAKPFNLADLIKLVGHYMVSK